MQRLLRQYYWMNLFGALLCAACALLASWYWLMAVDWMLAGINLTLFVIGKRMLDSVRGLLLQSKQLRDDCAQIEHLATEMRSQRDLFARLQQEIEIGQPIRPPTRH
jgi:hypothetical protein